jgi:AraC-like DNA-binding protein
MSIIEAGLRGGSVAILVLLAALLIRDAGRSPAERNCVLFLLSAAGYVVSSTLGFAGLDGPFGLSILVVSLGAPAVFWMAAAAVFDDQFKPAWQRGLAWLSLIVLGLWSVLDSQPIVEFAYYALSLVFVGLAAWHVIAGRETDLVEARRRLRALLALATASYIAALLITNFIWPGGTASAPFSLVNAIGLAAINFAIAMSWLGIAREQPSVAPPHTARSSSPRPESRPKRAPAARFSDEETALLEALRELMEVQKFYRHDGLSIAVLAGKLSVPEYRLRRLINRQLGYRNFSSFINSYRLTEAMAALADPSQADVPILTIALDTGFQSLAPFNRAFKVTARMTPSAYRRQCLGRLQPGLAN